MGFILLGFVIVTVLTGTWNIIYHARHRHDPGYLRAGKVDFSGKHRRWFLTDYQRWVGGTIGDTLSRRRRMRWFILAPIWFWLVVLYFWACYIFFIIVAWSVLTSAGYIAQGVWLVYWPQVVRHERRKGLRDKTELENEDALLRSMEAAAADDRPRTLI